MPLKKRTKKILTQKQKDFAKEYARTGNGLKSAKKVYDVKNDNVAKMIASRNITKDNVLREIEHERMSMIEALEIVEVTPKMVAGEIRNLLKAETPVWKNNNKTGKLEFKGYKPDYQARDKGITHFVKIRGDYAPEKHLFRGKIDFGKLNELSNEQLDRIISGKLDAIGAKQPKAGKGSDSRKGKKVKGATKVS